MGREENQEEEKSITSLWGSANVSLSKVTTAYSYPPACSLCLVHSKALGPLNWVLANMYTALLTLPYSVLRVLFTLTSLVFTTIL